MKITHALAALALASTVSGCAPDGGEPDESFGDSLAAPETADEAFLSVVREEDPTLDVMIDGDLIDLGHQVCDDIDSVPLDSPMLLATYMTTASEAAGQDLAFFIGASIGAFCPEHTYLVEGY